MKKDTSLVLPAALLLFLAAATGCRKPDLIIMEDTAYIAWTNTAHWVEIEIKNNGTANASPFVIHYNPVENPVSPSHQPHITYNVPGLETWDTLFIKVDFNPQAHQDNNNLGNVQGVTVVLDADDQVDESIESNNAEYLEVH